MASTNLKNKQLPVQFSEEDGWSLSKTDLDNHIKLHFNELREAAINAESISNKKLGIVATLLFSLVVIISVMAVSGAHIFAFLLALIALADVGPILKFLSKEEKNKTKEISWKSS